MEKRKYANGNEEVSLLGFGCMRFPPADESSQLIDESKSQKLIDHAIANGVNYFDTAYMYHNGQSENFIGKALKKYPRDSFYLADKMPPWPIKSGADVERIFEEQLRKCQVEYFDFYLLHNLSINTFPIIEKHNVYDILKEKQMQGKIRRLGFSFHDAVPLLEQIVDSYEWDFAQIQLNYLDWDQQDAKTLYNILTKNGIPVIVMEPVRGGALATLCDKSVKILKSASPESSTASWALRFAASLPNVLTVLSGMTTFEQLEDNLNTFSSFKTLSESEYETIKEALREYRLSGAIPCTACKYCMPCSYGVDIPNVFGVYNNFKLSKVTWQFMMYYNVLGEKKQAHHCVKCNECVKHCPQSINIPEHMEAIASFVESNRK